MIQPILTPLILGLLSLTYLFTVNPVLAHRSGCHRWHSCPSDSGSYTCGDLGYPCRYSTYPEGGYTYVPTYVLPAPQAPTSGKWEFKISNENWCNQDVVFSWDKGANADRYSIAASKTPGSDPGPIADTNNTSFTLTNLSPGKWYINVKGGNSERWSDVRYWTVDILKPSPSLNASLQTKGDKQYLHYQISCLKEVEGPSEWIDYLNTHDDAPVGDVLMAYSSPREINLKGIDKNNKEYVTKLTYQPIPHKEAQTQNDTSDGWFLLGVSVLGGITYMTWKITIGILNFCRRVICKLTNRG